MCYLPVASQRLAGMIEAFSVAYRLRTSAIDFKYGLVWYVQMDALSWTDLLI